MHDGHDQRDIAPTFNQCQLLANCMNKPALAALILEKFEIQLRSDLVKLLASAGAEDLAELGRVAHGLKGAAAACTASRVEALAERVETAARADEGQIALAALNELKAEIDRCISSIPSTRAAFAAC